MVQAYGSIPTFPQDGRLVRPHLHVECLDSCRCLVLLHGDVRHLDGVGVRRLGIPNRLGEHGSRARPLGLVDAFSNLSAAFLDASAARAAKVDGVTSF